MASESLVNRLEAAVAQIEALVPRLGAKARGGGGGDDEEDVPEFVTEYDTNVRAKLNAVSAAAEAAGVPNAKGPLETAFDCLGNIIKSTVACKKPEPQDWATLLKGAVDAIGIFKDAAFKRPKKGQPDLKDHYTGLKEFVTAFNWVTMAAPQLPAPAIESAEGSVMFSFNKILRSAKDAPNGDQLRALVKSTQAACKELYAYVKRYFKTGLEWNPQGSSATDFEAGAAPAPPAPAPAAEEKAPEEAPKPKRRPAAVLDLSELRLKAGGGKGVKGMRKVTHWKKTGDGEDPKPSTKPAADGSDIGKVEGSWTICEGRDRTARSGVVKRRTATSAAGKKRTAVVKKERPPSASCRANRWTVEHYKDNATYKIPEDKVNVRQTVGIYNCNSACIQVPGKVKSVMISNCQKCKVFVNEVISTVELVRCTSVTLIVQTKAPSINVDKCESARIILMRPAYEADPSIITSNISAMNIEIPGATDECDTIELPVPEQFITKINMETATLTTEEVKHG